MPLPPGARTLGLPTQASVWAPQGAQDRHRGETVPWNGPHASPLRISSLKGVCSTAGSCAFSRQQWWPEGSVGPTGAQGGSPCCPRPALPPRCLPRRLRWEIRSPGKPCCVGMYRKTQKTNHFILNRTTGHTDRPGSASEGAGRVGWSRAGGSCRRCPGATAGGLPGTGHLLSPTLTHTRHSPGPLE